MSAHATRRRPGLLAEALRARAWPAQLGGRNRRGATPPSEGFLMLLALLTVVGVFLSDLALAALDPRIRQGAERSR